MNATHRYLGVDPDSTGTGRSINEPLFAGSYRRNAPLVGAGIHTMPTDIIRCPLCDSPMTERMATRGPRAGNTFLGCTRFPVCRGNLPADGSSPRKGRGDSTSPGRKKAAPPKSAPNPAKQSLIIGDLLVSSANKLGVGKAVARHGNILVLEYFDHPGQAPSDRYRAEVPITGLRRFRLDQKSGHSGKRISCGDLAASKKSTNTAISRCATGTKRFS